MGTDIFKQNHTSGCRHCSRHFLLVFLYFSSAFAMYLAGFLFLPPSPHVIVVEFKQLVQHLHRDIRPPSQARFDHAVVPVSGIAHTW